MEIIISIILLAVFWRLFAALAVIACAVLVPLATALLTFLVSGSGVLALVAAGAAVVVWVSLMDDLANRFGG